MNWNMFSSCYISCNLFQARSTERIFWHPRHLHHFVLKFRCSTTSVLQNFKFLASSIVQASMSSFTRRGAVGVSSGLDTYIAEVQAGVTLSVNALEFWHARGPSGLARLAKNLICAPASQAYVERICFVCGLLYYGRRSSMFRSLEMWVCLKLSQIKCWKKPLLGSNRLSETWC